MAPGMGSLGKNLVPLRVPGLLTVAIIAHQSQVRIRKGWDPRVTQLLLLHSSYESDLHSLISW